MRICLIKNIKAMTLAEILVCVFILALVAMVIMPGLLLGQKQVHESKNRSLSTYTLQKELDNAIAESGDDAAPVTLKIQFGTKEFEVEGIIVEKEEVYNSSGNKAKAKVFIPQK
jgi:type II secretory pathway pseudopilin PulG